MAEEDTLRRLLDQYQLEPFIRHIRFPQYKNLSPDTRIDLTYPITGLVGQNGTDKSSILRALFGSPGQNNLGNLWFSTSIDPIEETGGKPSCFIYGYYNPHQNGVVEVLKTRIRKEGDPDYWEPSRPIRQYGMDPLPKIPAGTPIPLGRSKTRWDNIEKDVVYIDFRAALSAFDKFFYHGELRTKENTAKNRKDFIRRRAKPLRRAIDEDLSSLKFRRRERIVGKNRVLSESERAAVSYILGREYSAIRLIRHTFFNCDAFTCLLQAAGLRYTEAFAGSGEFAVVRLVADITSAPPKSLILLDEPEVSLHPGAQERLLSFLTRTVIESKHQVIISTHSPAMVRKLPPDAIKVFVLDPAMNKVRLPSQAALPEEAFFHLGEPVQGSRTIIVEDILAKALVERALRALPEAKAKLFEVRFFPGGSETLWKHYVPIFSAEDRSDVLVLFDGDKRLSSEFPDPDDIPVAEDGMLGQKIKQICGVDVVFPVDSGTDQTKEAQLSARRRLFLTWVRAHVDYLPGAASPEDFIWENMQTDDIAGGVIGSDAKQRFSLLATKELGLAEFEQVDSKSILGTQLRRLATVPHDNPALTTLRERLLQFLEARQS